MKRIRNQLTIDEIAYAWVIATVAYAGLHCKTNFLFLEGASFADELVARASELGYAALAITDRSRLAGVVRAQGAAKQTGLKLQIGDEKHALQVRGYTPILCISR